ncbi:MAG: hypothetical protein APF84_09140 [Gracilibacter sp. BRH_c7a]|nr:MAG: hypothetical protein APF84_09140 [Gracilibacter sp. BRH_c7a]
MRKIYVMAVLAVMMILSSSGCNTQQMPPEKPQDFAFILKYGIGAHNELNTIEGTFTKDLILAGTTTIPLELSNDELNKIYNEMCKINITLYPEEYKPDNDSVVQRWVTPCETYELWITYNGKQQQIVWIDSSLSEKTEAKNLRNLINLITSTIESKEEVKKLPDPKGGYL